MLASGQKLPSQIPGFLMLACSLVSFGEFVGVLIICRVQLKCFAKKWDGIGESVALKIGNSEGVVRLEVVRFMHDRSPQYALGLHGAERIVCAIAAQRARVLRQRLARAQVPI